MVDGYGEWCGVQVRSTKKRSWLGMLVVGYTDTPTWICPGDWDQILHLSKATLHQRHSNEVVFYCKLSSRGVYVWGCVRNCVLESREQVTRSGRGGKNQERKRLKERCVGLSSLSISKRSIRSVHTSCLCSNLCKILRTVCNACACEDIKHFDGGIVGKQHGDLTVKMFK